MNVIMNLCMQFLSYILDFLGMGIENTGACM